MRTNAAVWAVGGVLMWSSGAVVAQAQVGTGVASETAPAVGIAVPVGATEGDFRVVLERVREVLMRGEVPPVEKVRGYVDSLGANGKWGDINYADATPASWATAEHLERVRMMARSVVDPKSALYNDAKTEEAMGRALDDWIANRYKNPNWWHNDIGVPRTMADILVLLGDRLSGARRAGALEVLHQYGKAKPGGGANTMWMATLALVYGALTRDGELVGANSRLISDEIRMTQGEGIQYDNSFHQHRQRLQQFHYGASFVNDAAQLGWQLRGTPWAIAPEKLLILANCVLGGSQWMVRGTTTVPGTLDRSVSRPGAMNGGDLRGVARNLRAALPQSGPGMNALIGRELDALIARQDGTGAPLVGFRSFARSDFASYQRPGFAFFLKTLSDRTFSTESINGENLKGHLLNMGDHYLLRDGSEYSALPPVWDWDALPGVTWAPGAGEPVRQPFVGAVDDGQSGAAVMDARFASKEGAALGVKKLWACHGDVVVCLMGGLTATGLEAPVHTALDQCQLHGLVTICEDDGNQRVIGLDRDRDKPDDFGAPSLIVLNEEPIRWLHHAGFVYAPLDKTPVALRVGKVTGTWASINKSGSKQTVTLPVFLPTLEHGKSPQGAASGFVIAPARTPGDAARVLARPSWEVLRNDASCQAVRFEDGTLMAAFYEPASVKTGAFTELSVDAPCLVLVTATTPKTQGNEDGWARIPDAVFATDPAHKGGPVNLKLGTRRLTVTLPGSGVVKSQIPEEE